MENPTLIIRADSNSSMGIGHIMRCLALAQVWRLRGGRIVYAGRCGSPSLVSYLKKQGFLTPARTATSMDTTRWLTELKSEGILQCTSDNGQWMVLDGYHFNKDFQKAIRNFGVRLLVIDDMNHLDGYDADALLNPNIYASRLTYRLNPDAVCLMGTMFAPIRQEFLSTLKPTTPSLSKDLCLLVTMGGADPDNVTAKVLDAISMLPDNPLWIKVILGPANRHRKALLSQWQRIEASMRPRRQRLEMVSEPDMPSLLNWSDIAITASGSTCLELCFMGVAFATIVLADNQHSVAEGLAAVGASLNWGWHHRLSPDSLARRINAFMKDNILQTHIRENARKLIDGRGALRVVEHLWPSSLKLRKAAWADAETVFAWANDSETRSASFQKAPISRETHLQWFREKLSDPECFYYVAETSDDRPVGQVRFDCVSNQATVSVSIDKASRGMGWGNRIVKKGYQKLFEESSVTRVCAFIRPENTKSLKAFQRAGFDHCKNSGPNEPSSISLQMEKKK